MAVKIVVVLLAATAAWVPPASADDQPWFINGPVVITEPTELGNVILLSGGSLTVVGAEEPGLRISGDIWALQDSKVRFEDSVVQFMSVYHGQYALVGAHDARIEVVGCDYRVPNGVQHALFVTDRAEMLVEDTDFEFVQLLSAGRASLAARRLTGDFEVLVENDAKMVLADIPREPGQGSIWVWVEFPSGSVAEYSPPPPGFVEHWEFPPPGSQGINQSATVDRCETLLWPMLVREASSVTLRDIPEEHWVVVGFHLPDNVTVRGLENDRFYGDVTLDLEDREFRLVNAAVDAWNLYPQDDAHVSVLDCHLGEILSMGVSRVWVERTLIDGTGGFFGARDSSRIIASDCRFTCTVEAAQESTIELHGSRVEPYAADPSGEWTRFGAYDDARLFADQTAVSTIPVLGDRGLIAVSYVHDPPDRPPGLGDEESLFGSIAHYSLDPDVAALLWRLEVGDRSGAPLLLGEGDANAEEEVLGIWSGANPLVDHRIQAVLTDGLGRTLVGNIVVSGTDARVR